MKSLQNELENAAQGLFIISETDAPLEFISFQNTEKGPLNEDKVLAMTGNIAGSQIKREELEDFFRKYARSENPETGIKHNVDYHQVIEKLNEILKDVQVWITGENNMEVFILGSDKNGNYSGYRTQIVES